MVILTSFDLEIMMGEVKSTSFTKQQALCWTRAVVLGDNIIQLGLFLCMSGAVVGVGVILHLGFLPVR